MKIYKAKINIFLKYFFYICIVFSLFNILYTIRYNFSYLMMLVSIVTAIYFLFLLFTFYSIDNECLIIYEGLITKKIKYKSIVSIFPQSGITKKISLGLRPRWVWGVRCKRRQYYNCI